MSDTEASAGSDLMTSKEVADSLRLPLPTVYYLAKTGQLPSFQIGRRWRFHRSEIERLKAGDGHPPKVLVLDDESAIRLVLDDTLTAAGCVVSTAAGIDEALSLTEEAKFDALIVDLVLGPRRGVEFIQAVREDYSLRQVVVITGYPDLLETAPLLELGPITVVRKPFLPGQIIECIEQICGRSLRVPAN